MKTNDYLSNPVIAKNFYNAKCTDVDVRGEPDQPTVIVQLRIVPYEPYGEAQEQILHITLRNSLKAQPMHESFRQIFRIERCPTEAIGRFCSIYVDVDEYNGTRYSAVHLIQQNGIARRQAKALERADRNGDIPWSAMP